MYSVVQISFFFYLSECLGLAVVKCNSASEMFMVVKICVFSHTGQVKQQTQTQLIVSIIIILQCIAQL